MKFGTGVWGRLLLSMLIITMLVGINACQSGGSLNVPRGLPNSLPENQAQRILAPNPVGEVIGNGNVRVSLLVPQTIPGNAATIAQEIRNGAAMAMEDAGKGILQLVVKDTKGQAAVSQTAANEAIREGSSLVLGPLFAANVSASAGITLPANVVMLAFSTDATVARRGVYLLSFTPEDDTRRILEYAASQNVKSMTAFLSSGAEGVLRERILREIAGSRRILLNIVRYDRSSEGVQKAVTDGAIQAQSSESLYIPEGGPIPNIILTGLSRNGVSLQQKRVFGSGAWESVKTGDASVQGAYYPGRDVTRFADFANRYETRFGVQPGVQAALGYDAVTLASELVRLNGPERAFQPESFESQRGYQGINGIFRILPSGLTERSLAIYQISGGRGQLIEPAARTFSRSGFASR